jgi:alanyl-tRNA synthetase
MPAKSAADGCGQLAAIRVTLSSPPAVTERLYHTEAYVTEFDATVLSAEPIPEQNKRYGVVLDRTAFYPSCGGQPFDTGTLGATRVIDVVDRDDGSILHVVEGAIAAGPVHGTIDWTRRFDHMQQHTGQHVLSAAFDRLLGVRTVSFHLGSAGSTIDLEREVSAVEVARAEAEANRIVWEDRPVAIRFVEAGEAAALGLRKESTREGVLRLIDVEQFDLSACGGTHVARTGAIGIVAIAGSERFKGGTRIEFLCGGRALAGFRALRAAVDASVRLLNVTAAELPAAIERGQTDAKDLRRQIKDIQTRLAGYEAASLADKAETLGTFRAVIAALDGYDANGLKSLAGAIVSRPGHVAVLLGTPTPSPIVVARAPDVAVDSGAILKQMIGAFGGKGGGRPELAQGGGLTGAVDAMVEKARALIGV